MAKIYITINENLPVKVDCSIRMEEPNEDIILFQGTYCIVFNKKTIPIGGNLFFKWIPNKGVFFEGHTKDDDDFYYIFNSNFQEINLKINDLEIAKGFITLKDSTHFKIEGTLYGKIVLGDKSVPGSKLKFSIPNFKSFNGSPIRDEEERKSWSGRISIENNHHIIKIDKHYYYKERFDSLKRNGGYILLYCGEIIPKKGKIEYSEIDDILNGLRLFLTFINGKRTSPMFVFGQHNDKTLWKDCSHVFVDPYKSDSRSWSNNYLLEDISNIYKNFTKLFNDQNDKDFINSVIHWYITANNRSGYIEGSIPIAQIALELIYNWWIVEKKEILIGEDSNNINASNKIRLLLSHIAVSSQIPDGLKNLKDYIKNLSQNYMDGPEIISLVRNSIVHSNKEKRKKLRAIPPKAAYEVLELALWYIELSLLKILDYKGLYNNRCSESQFKSGIRERVPWFDNQSEESE